MISTVLRNFTFPICVFSMGNLSERKKFELLVLTNNK